MSIEEQEIKTVLTNLECRTNFTMKKITEFMLPNVKEAFYLHIEGNTPHVIIRPVFEVFANDLNEIEGVTKRTDYFHNAQMTRFPKRVHKGINEIYYGVSFKFDDKKAVKKFIQKLINIITPQ